MVSYSDILPSNSDELLVAILFLLVAGIAFGVVIGEFSKILNKID